MSITNRAELKSAVESMAGDRSITDAQFNVFLTQTESQLNRRLRVQRMVIREKLVDGTTSGQFLYSLPADSLDLINVESENNGNRCGLQQMSAEALDAMYGWRDGGAPEAYSIIGRDIEVRPCPNAEYPLRVSYYQRIPPLTATDDTNWLLSLYPDVYLYGVLQFMATWVRDMEAVKMWSELYGNAMTEIERASDMAEWSGSTPEMVAI